MATRTVETAGKRLAILEESDYLRLAAGRVEPMDENPALPRRNAAGRMPAAAYILASIAREIVAERTHAGLTQAALSRRAGIRQETLSRIESAKQTPTRKTLEQIDRALGDRKSRRN